jgi:hypothetical protein
LVLWTFGCSIISMSDHEFENYLALLTRLLRLEGKQREAISDELRSHLEDRLDDLLARGVGRQEAIRQALEEFGDAAALAADFVSISRNRRRRWLMRVTTFSVAAMMLIAAGIAIFWPGRNAGPGVAAVIAQNPQVDPFGAGPAAATQNRVADPFGPPEAAAAAAKQAEQAKPTTLEAKLNQRFTIEFVEMPLTEAVQYLRDQTGVQFVVKTKKLEEAGVSPDKALTMNLQQVRLATLLDLLLDELELTYVEKDELLIVTTPEDAEATLLIRVYDCRDLLAMEAPPGSDQFVPAPVPAPARRGGMFSVEDTGQAGQPANPAAQPSGSGSGGGGFGGSVSPGPQGGFGSESGEQSSRPMTLHDVRAEQLMDIILTNVDPQTWDDVGGPGSISEYNGLVVVTQTAQVHKKVERVLDMLREAAGLEVPKTGKVVR